MDYRLDGIADCIYSIYQALLDAPLREEHENSFVLRYEWLIRETAKKVWESNDYSFPKCFECTLKKESKRTDCLYCDIGWEESFYIEDGYPAFDLHAPHDTIPYIKQYAPFFFLTFPLSTLLGVTVLSSP